MGPQASAVNHDVPSYFCSIRELIKSKLVRKRLNIRQRQKSCPEQQNPSIGRGVFSWSHVLSDNIEWEGFIFLWAVMWQDPQHVSEVGDMTHA